MFTAHRFLILAVAVAFGATTAIGLAAESAERFAGHWAGHLALPTGPLEIRVELGSENDSSWRGTIDIPAQGVRGFKLGVTVAGRRLRFTMAGVPGDPTYTGTLSDNGAGISGEYTQGGARFPFTLQRTTAAAARAEPAIPPGIPGRGAAGHWLGVLQVTDSLTLRVALELRSPQPMEFEATLVSIDQQNARMPASLVNVRDDEVRLELQRPVAAFAGRLNREGSEIAGTWIQQNRRTPLTFRRQATNAAVARPQDPVRPYPYDDYEVGVRNAAPGVTLAGTLTVPRGPGPHPAAVLITGSGPQDRDQPVAGHRTFLVLADHLTRAGIAVLRCDDRGVGKSTGDFGAALQSEFVADTLAAVAWLRARPEIDPGRVGLIGHSEGGMVAPRAAAQSPEVAFIVLLAAPGLPMRDVMLRQGRDIGLAMGMSEEFVARNEATQREVLEILGSEMPATAAMAAMRKVLDGQYAGLSDDQRIALGLPKAGAPNPQLKLVESPWLRDALRGDPREALQAVRCPVLALTGGRDLQVAAKENLSAIRAALTAGGNACFETRELPGLNHLFQTCRNGAPYEYAQIEETFSPGALQVITDWILRVADGSR